MNDERDNLAEYSQALENYLGALLGTEDNAPPQASSPSGAESSQSVTAAHTQAETPSQEEPSEADSVLIDAPETSTEPVSVTPEDGTTPAQNNADPDTQAAAPSHDMPANASQDTAQNVEPDPAVAIDTRDEEAQQRQTSTTADTPARPSQPQNEELASPQPEAAEPTADADDASTTQDSNVIDCWMVSSAGVTLVIACEDIMAIEPWPLETDIAQLRDEPIAGEWAYGERKIVLIDTARLILPEAHHAALKPLPTRAREVLILANGAWGLVTESDSQHVNIAFDTIHWREQNGHRPWLAGMVSKPQCALLNASGIVDYLIPRDEVGLRA